MVISKSLSLLSALGVCVALASFASAASDAEGPEAASREPSPAVAGRIAQYQIGMATFGAATVVLVAELDQIPNYAPKSEASRACYDTVLPAVDPLMDDVQASKRYLETGHQCTVDSEDACWMPVFDKVDAQVADLTTRMGEVRRSLEACRKLGS